VVPASTCSILLLARQPVEAIDPLFERASDRPGQVAHADVEIIVEHEQIFRRPLRSGRGRRLRTLRRLLRLRLHRGVELQHVDRLRREAQHREEHEARDQKKTRGTDEAPTFAFEVRSREEAGTKQQRKERLPQLAVEREIPARGLAHELRERRQTIARVLTALRTKSAASQRAAVRAAGVCAIGVGRDER
jgi:ribosomal protein L29